MVAPTILVSADITFIPKFEGGHPVRGRWMRVGGYDQYAAVSPKRCEIRHRLLLISYRKSNTRFRLVPKSTTLVDPEMTLDGNYVLRCIALHTCVSELTTKIWMKIDPCYQQQKRSPWILVSNKKFNADIRGGSLERGRRMRVGWSKMAIFASFARYIFRTFISEASFIILCYVAR